MNLAFIGARVAAQKLDAHGVKRSIVQVMAAVVAGRQWVAEQPCGR